MSSDPDGPTASAPHRPRDVGDSFRCGVHLRPDARTCHAVTTATAQLRARYGFVSAGAFPPHATLVGTQHLGRDEEAVVREEVGASLDELDLPVPASFVGRTVALHRTGGDDWSGRWWRTPRWEHLHSWTLPAG